MLHLFNGILAATAEVNDRRLLASTVDELLYEPWASLWSSRAVITRSDFKSDVLQFLAYSGIILTAIHLKWQVGPLPKRLRRRG